MNGEILKNMDGILAANLAKPLVLIGSVAMNLATACEIRKPNDLDVVGTYDDLVFYMKAFAENSGKKLTALLPFDKGTKLVGKYDDKSIIEAEIAWEGSTAEELHKLAREDEMRQTWGMFTIPSMDLLYALKMSHRYKKNSQHFRKTMDDILFLRSFGAKIRDEHMEFFKRREKETYNYAHPKLNVSKKDFFDGDDVPYVYDHDSIHVAVKHLDRPAYSYFKPEDQEVLCDRKMFEELPEEIKLYSVLEEAYVLAIERSQVPFKGQLTPKQSFDIALMKVCTSITSGWWREYAWEHYHQAQELYSDSYADKFWNAVALGKVKPFTGSKY